MDLPTEDPIRSLAEEETVLPCRYKPVGDNVLVQVTWFKEKPDTTKEQIILAHHTNGQTGQLSSWTSSSGFLAYVVVSLHSLPRAKKVYINVSTLNNFLFLHCENFFLS